MRISRAAAAAALAAASAVAGCDISSFPVPINGTVYVGLHKASAATDAGSCADACCAEGDACALWQWGDSGEPKGQGCWIGGAGLPTKPQDGWVSRGRGIPPPPPPPPPAPSTPPPKPTAAQLRWMKNEIGAIGHFNMGTYESCGIGAELMEGNGDQAPKMSVPPPETFAPVDVDADQWVKALASFGAKRAVLVVSHGCGFNTFPSRTQIPGYGTHKYNIAQSPWKGGKGDIAQEFVDACKKYGVSPGFYHGAMNNAYLGVRGGKANGQAACSFCPALNQTQYTQVLLDNLRQLWTDYGELAEVWFDGGYPPGSADPIAALQKELQPNTVGFQGPGQNVIRWCGTEGGHVGYPFWSTSGGSLNKGAGSADGKVFAPGEADTCFQGGRREGSVAGPYGGCWFYNDGMGVKSLSELVSSYHETNGRNAFLLLDWTPTQNGTLRPDHIARYAEFGDWVRACYAAPLAAVDAPRGGNVTLALPAGADADRVVIAEDQTNGELIREYTVSVDGAVVATGTSVGNKRIALFDRPRAGKSVTVAVSGLDGLQLARVSVHNCSRTPAPEGCSFEDSFAYKVVKSITISTSTGGTLSACCAACRAEQTCAVFVYTKDEKSCALLSANQGGEAQDGAVSGAPKR